MIIMDLGPILRKRAKEKRWLRRYSWKYSEHRCLVEDHVERSCPSSSFGRHPAPCCWHQLEGWISRSTPWYRVFGWKERLLRTQMAEPWARVGPIVGYWVCDWRSCPKSGMLPVCLLTLVLMESRPAGGKAELERTISWCSETCRACGALLS